MNLYRPMCQAELDLVIASGWKAFPPRLPHMDYFYPVLTLAYARQVHRWNHDGGIVRFRVDLEYCQKYPVQTVGSREHQELWVPADELEEFNRHVTKIELVASLNTTVSTGQHYGRDIKCSKL